MSLDIHMRLYQSARYSNYLEICPDADGLGMVEIRLVTDEQKITSRILVSLENVDDLITAIQTVRKDMAK